uniref:Uncharacterized protein n=1 Tax=Rhipicephalus zambeziensis TaxID=60191 RepID=A0A224Y980_9ACAR
MTAPLHCQGNAYLRSTNLLLLLKGVRQRTTLHYWRYSSYLNNEPISNNVHLAYDASSRFKLRNDLISSFVSPNYIFFVSDSPLITHFTHDPNILALLLATLTFNVSYLCSLFNTYRRHYTSYL